MSLRIRPLEIPEHHDDDTETGRRFRESVDLRNRVMAELWGSDDFALTHEALHGAALPTSSKRQHRHVAIVDGHVVGSAQVDVSLHETTAPAHAYVAVDPDRRRQGIGAALAARADELLAAEGRAVTHVWTEHPEQPGPRIAPPNGAGSVPSDSDIVRLLTRTGFTLEQVERASILDLGSVDRDRLAALRDAAELRAAGYAVESWAGFTPPEHRDSVADLHARMSTDVPAGGLVVEPEAWTPERLRESEERQIRRLGLGLRRTVAFDAEGAAVAFTLLTVSPTGALVHQEDTLVHADHRGHRLGMLVKAVNLLGLLEAHPDRERVVTWNAVENEHMLAVNDALGFTTALFEGAWQRRERQGS